MSGVNSYKDGVVAKLYKGTTLVFERRKVNDEVWLPTRTRVNMSGRALIRKFSLEAVIEYSDYRKFSVNTDTTFDRAKQP